MTFNRSKEEVASLALKSPKATVLLDAVEWVLSLESVYLIKVDDPSLAWFGAGDFPVRKFLIDGRKGNVGVLGNLLWRDRENTTK